MSMPIPLSPRVLYTKNPLTQVVCQLRFPTILKIATELPAEFQAQIRAHYPEFATRRDEPVPEIASSLPPQVAALVRQVLSSPVVAPTYDFISEDQAWRVSLSSNFVALTTMSYSRWETFWSQFEPALNALKEVYAPAYYSRVGLRYVDVVRPADLFETIQKPWSELLQPHIAADLSSEDVRDDIEESVKQFVLRLVNHEGWVRVQHGLHMDDQTKRMCYAIDSDFYRDTKTEVTDVFAVLQYFNRQAGNLFRWCILPDLHDAMGPESVS